jgi:hypothetical protein
LTGIYSVVKVVPFIKDWCTPHEPADHWTLGLKMMLHMGGELMKQHTVIGQAIWHELLLLLLL